MFVHSGTFRYLIWCKTEIKPVVSSESPSLLMSPFYESNDHHQRYKPVHSLDSTCRALSQGFNIPLVKVSRLIKLSWIIHLPFQRSGSIQGLVNWYQRNLWNWYSIIFASSIFPSSFLLFLLFPFKLFCLVYCLLIVGLSMFRFLV